MSVGFLSGPWSGVGYWFNRSDTNQGGTPVWSKENIAPFYCPSFSIQEGWLWVHHDVWYQSWNEQWLKCRRLWEY
jgi:hypothetical protein